MVTNGERKKKDELQALRHSSTSMRERERVRVEHSTHVPAERTPGLTNHVFQTPRQGWISS
ncbi:Hypothetical protein FKW44_000370 [Caligus rogercresseyi]|uniref:Uncharacterized protein n=1 Tax=Caligus rogercresseyi TaxID=217165 RepID=A0A7T8KH79_CALRO|nr:Hypothetical protein FKW44_000370 [Caligus rogercresseyi]